MDPKAKYFEETLDLWRRTMEPREEDESAGADAHINENGQEQATANRLGAKFKLRRGPDDLFSKHKQLAHTFIGGPDATSMSMECQDYCLRCSPARN